jgi:hypothetical protein
MSWLDLYQNDRREALRVQPNEGHDLPGYWALHSHGWTLFGAWLAGLSAVALCLVFRHQIGAQSSTLSRPGVERDRDAPNLGATAKSAKLVLFRQQEGFAMSGRLRSLIGIWEEAIAVLDRQIAALEAGGQISQGIDAAEETALWLDQLRSSRALHIDVVADWRLRLEATEPDPAPGGFQQTIPSQHRAGN